MMHTNHSTAVVYDDLLSMTLGKNDQVKLSHQAQDALALAQEKVAMTAIRLEKAAAILARVQKDDSAAIHALFKAQTLHEQAIEDSLQLAANNKTKQQGANGKRRLWPRRSPQEKASRETVNYATQKLRRAQQKNRQSKNTVNFALEQQHELQEAHKLAEWACMVAFMKNNEAELDLLHSIAPLPVLGMTVEFESPRA